MSSVAIQGNASGAGVFTIASPNSASSYTATLPAKTGTLGMDGPAFSAYFNGSTQSISASTWTKVTMNAEDFDTNTNYDPTTNYRFTPTVAGYYQITSVVYWENGTATQSGLSLAIYKNGSIYRGVRNLVQASGGGSATISLPMLFNGSTDYVEVYVWSGQAGTVFGSTNTTGGGANSNNALFNGCLIRGT